IAQLRRGLSLSRAFRDATSAGCTGEAQQAEHVSTREHGPCVPASRFHRLPPAALSQKAVAESRTAAKLHFENSRDGNILPRARAKGSGQVLSGGQAYHTEVLSGGVAMALGWMEYATIQSGARLEVRGGMNISSVLSGAREVMFTGFDWYTTIWDGGSLLIS